MIARSEEHTSELQSHVKLVCRLLLEKKKHPRFRQMPVAKRILRIHEAAYLHFHTDRRTVACIQRRRPAPYGPALQLVLFFFNDSATTEIYTLSLHDALPIYLCHLDGPGTERSIHFHDKRPPQPR